ncbi:Fanconi anemia group A protein [Danio aesculapii]|uniref:Fanconi anemia group A protein n=1 Tax=Danio aesculapii TaxID=1142201 RepID=UPI0024BFE2B4|nr:Fanconi anemia group A protein [Danio aesculapii]
MLSSTADAEQPTHTSVTALLARRSLKRPRDDDEEQLQESCVNLLMRNQNTSLLLQEMTAQQRISSAGLELHTHMQTAALEDELRRLSQLTDVPLSLLCVRVVTEALQDRISHTDHVLLSAEQRAEVCVLLKSAQALMSAGLFSAELLWQEYWRTQPILEVVYHLHTHSILTLDLLLDRDAAVSSWISDQLKALCVSMKNTEEEQQLQKHMLDTVVCVLVRRAFEDCTHKHSQTCVFILDSMLTWLLDSLNDKDTETSSASVWIQVFDASVFGVCVSEDTLRQFFTHTLTRVLTHRPVFTVSDAIAVQSDWSFAKTPALLTALFRKLCVLFSVQCVLAQLQQVLETHEVNWRLILSCVSHLLVFDCQTQSCLSEVLRALLSSAFLLFDVEQMISVFLLVRQAALEGPAVFRSYSDWFKLSFAGASGAHAKSKKTTVFLLKFLSDLVPFEPPQYLKVHVLHPPFVSGKHRSVLQEYVSLARTRLRDLKVSLEESGIFEVVNGSAGAPACGAQQDVEKAVTLFINTGKIPATVIEASIFRRPYFMSRFLPALLSPRVLPPQADSRMSFIEALRRAEKIPAALYCSYTESCQRETHTLREGVCDSSDGGHLMVLQDQFQCLRRIICDGAADGEVCAQLSRISLTLNNIGADEDTGTDVITLNLLSADWTHATLANLILQSFCLCLLDSAKISPPNRQGSWACVLVKALLAHRWLISALLHRLWDLLQNQGEALSAAHVLGLSALHVELHHCRSVCPPVQLLPSADARCVSECVCDALSCCTDTHMHTCLRFCVSVLSYGLCRATAQAEELHVFIPHTLFKKAQFVMSRLVPETRALLIGGLDSESPSAPAGGLQESAVALWRNTHIRALRRQPDYQLSFSDWLTAELQVQRSRDALTDAERQEFQQWACELYYLPMAAADGGCGGDVTQSCARIITALLDQHTLSQAAGTHGHTDSCLPDLLSLLQALLYEAAVTPQKTPDDTHHFLWDLIESRCSVTPDPQCIAEQLRYQQTLQNISRVVCVLPAALLIRVDTGGSALDCRRIIKHITDVQMRTCVPDALLSCKLTTLFLKAIVSGSVSCRSPADAVNECVCVFSTRCPLLLLSAVRWWARVSSVLVCQWRRLTAGETLPDQLQMLEDTHCWSARVCGGLSSSTPAAPSWLLAAALQASLQHSDPTAALAQLDHTHTQVLLFLFLYSVIELISAHLSQQECVERVRGVCVCLLTRLQGHSDWLLLFDQSGSDHELCEFRARVISHHALRLLPLAFYSVLCAVDSQLLQGLVSSPGFLHSAGVSYRKLSELYLSAESAGRPQVLLDARRVLLSSISLSSPDCLTCAQRKQLQSELEQLDAEMAAAFSGKHTSTSALTQT